MHAKTLFSVVWKTQYDFLALRHLAVCTKNIFSFFQNFLCFWTKTRYFNTRFVFFFGNNKNKQTDIKQNDIKNTRKNCKIPKIFFLIFLLTKKKNWVGPGPPILGWAWPCPYTVGWTQPSRVGWADVPTHNQLKGWLLCCTQ
jgi:hypothetical protein